MSNIKSLYTGEQIQERKDVWWDSFDDINLSVTNLNCALECAYQNQYSNKDFDGWIMDKIREDMSKLHKLVDEAKKKFDD